MKLTGPVLQLPGPTGDHGIDTIDLPIKSLHVALNVDQLQQYMYSVDQQQIIIFPYRMHTNIKNPVVSINAHRQFK